MKDDNGVRVDIPPEELPCLIPAPDAMAALSRVLDHPSGYPRVLGVEMEHGNARVHKRVEEDFSAEVVDETDPDKLALARPCDAHFAV